MVNFYEGVEEIKTIDVYNPKDDYLINEWVNKGWVIIGMNLQRLARFKPLEEGGVQPYDVFVTRFVLAKMAKRK